MPKVLSYEAVIRGGARIENRLIVPIVSGNPDTPEEGQVWLNTATNSLNYQRNGATNALTPQDLDEEGVFNVLAGALRSGNNIDLNIDNAANTITVDVEALTSADIGDFIAAVRGAISGGNTATANTSFAGGAISVDVTDSPALGGNGPAFYTNVDNHTDGTTNHVFTAADDTKLAGIESGATANASDAFLRARDNHTGTQTANTISDFTTAARNVVGAADSGTLDLNYNNATGTFSGEVLDAPTLGGNAPGFYTNVDNHTDGATNHVFTAADDTKLAGIADGATANATDAFLVARENHTGTQPASTISDFTAAARGSISVEDSPSAYVNFVNGRISVEVTDSPTLDGADRNYYRNVDNHVDGTTNRVFTATDNNKLDSIENGATANSTDAALRDRTTHTGTQTASTISDFAAAVASLNIDATTLNGMTNAEIQSAVTAAIVDTAPGTLDTLNELAAALGDDPNFATTITNALNARSRNFTDVLVGGAATETVTHNLGTRHLVVQVFVDSGNFEDEEYIIERPTLNTVRIVSEGAVIPAGRRVVIHAVGNGA